jgi:tetratricopeptide (TPR) repeat protein
MNWQSDWCDVVRTALHAFIACTALTLIVPGCGSNDSRKLRQTAQQINTSKTRSDDVRQAARYLAQVTPVNREVMGKEVQLYLNKWAQTTELPPLDSGLRELFEGLPPDLRSEAGATDLEARYFSPTDIETIYQNRIFRVLGDWVIANPLRDTLLVPGLQQLASQRPADQVAQLEEACKLFDWTVRNIALQGSAEDVERLPDDPRKPLSDNGLGYGYLPWETCLYSRGDFIERGRVFDALAKQRGMETCWLALRLPTSPVPKIWAVGVWIGDDCFVFEPKLGLPIVHPDSVVPATLTEIQSDARILRRCDIPGKFDYAVNPGDAANVEFLLDVEPLELAPRAAVLESLLLGEERMKIATTAPALVQKLKRLYPTASIALWQTPLLARIYANSVRERLQMNSAFTANYMVEHAAWFMETPAASARIKHLAGAFENSFDEKGALMLYMDCRIPDEQLDRLPENPDTQKELGIPRLNNEELPAYQARLRQFQAVFGRAKLDANFLLGQLHFDLGNYDSAEGWFSKRTLGDERARVWFPAAWYTLARAYQENGKLDQAVEAYTQTPSPMEAGNRLRIRYLTRQ